MNKKMNPVGAVDITTSEGQAPILVIQESGIIAIPMRVDGNPEYAARFVEACALHLLSFADEIRERYGKECLGN